MMRLQLSDEMGMVLAGYYRMLDEWERREMARQRTEGDIGEMRGLLYGEALIPSQGVARLGGNRGRSVSRPTERAAERYGDEVERYTERLRKKQALLLQLTAEMQDLAEGMAPVRDALGRLGLGAVILERVYRYDQSYERIAREVEWGDGEARTGKTVKNHCCTAKVELARWLAGVDLRGVRNY